MAGTGTVDFSPPSYRAASSDLTISISPLGLVELADEEFEIHGPRLNRYSLNWAMYLGHHYAYRREQGEPQVVLNYYRTMVDYINRFTFGRGVHFRSPKATEALVPDILERVWTHDNEKEKVLLEMGQQGSVSGDCFVKVAYEEPWVDSVGRQHPGRVRILPLNASFAFPEFHPHDRNRLLRFKLKYRFWGTSLEGTRQVFCVDDSTEALTRRGWVHHSDLTNEDEILTLNPESKVMEWQPVLSVHRFDYDDDMVHWTNSHGFDALTTPNHRWLTAHRDRDGYSHLDRPGRFMITEELSGSNKQIITSGLDTLAFASTPIYSNEFVELIGWAVTEGHYQKAPAKTGVLISQSESANPEKTERIRMLVKFFADQGATATEQQSNRTEAAYAGVRDFYFGKGIGNLIRAVAPDKRLTPEFLSSLTLEQAELLYETLLDGDGHRSTLRNHDGYNRTVRTDNFIQKKSPLVDDYQMLAIMLGKRTASKEHSVHPSILNTVTYSRPTTTARHLKDNRVHYTGTVWCPRTPNQTWVARRNGSVFVTGNTYTEILTDETIEEYINDELIDQRPNPIGTIPVVHIPNIPVSGSPWGLAEAHDIIAINRQYNEIATDIADIVNYHAAPVTVIVGAKASQLEKGPKKVWGGLPKDSQVFNLEGGGNGMRGALEYMEVLKRSMHEIMGIPETALGQVQPISNTSGVALSMQYQPLMNRYAQKKVQYGTGIERINELVLLTIAIKEPELLQYNPEVNGPIKPTQLDYLDPQSPITYTSFAHFPPPLPLDQLVVLNEVQMKMGMGLESKEGALRTLGEEFPEEKLAEIRSEMMDDAKADGAMNLLKTQIAKEIMDLTGMMPGPDGMASPIDPMMMADGDVLGDGIDGPPDVAQVDDVKIAEVTGEAELRQELVVEAYGTKIPQFRATDPDPDD